MNPAFTIGHSNHTIERFLELLEGQGINVVVDVRSTSGGPKLVDHPPVVDGMHMPHQRPGEIGTTELDQLQPPVTRAGNTQYTILCNGAIIVLAMLRSRLQLTFRLVPGSEVAYDSLHQAISPDLVREIRADRIVENGVVRVGTLVFVTIGHPFAAAAYGRVAATQAAPTWSERFADLVEAAPELADPVWRLHDREDHW